MSAKKKARFLRIGPPSVPPNWSRSSSGFPAAGLKNPVAFIAVSRKNSHAAPLKRLVPLRYDTLIVPPALRPYSALMLLVTTRNSATASGDGCITWFEKPWLLVPYALLSIPSSRKLLNVLRSPLMLKDPSRTVEAEPVFNGERRTP